MRYATFVNFTEKPFTGYWNGRAYTFNPGQRKEHLAEGIAAHFAKHLTNSVLMAEGGDNVRYASPKKPDEVPQFKEIFDKAFFLEGGQEVDAETGLAEGEQKDEPSMNIKTVPREPTGRASPKPKKAAADKWDAASNAQGSAKGPPEVIGESEEDGFEGK